MDKDAGCPAGVRKNLQRKAKRLGLKIVPIDA